MRGVHIGEWDLCMLTPLDGASREAEGLAGHAVQQNNRTALLQRGIATRSCVDRNTLFDTIDADLLK